MTALAITDSSAYDAEGNVVFKRGVSFRTSDRIAGGTAGAIRREAITGRPVGGRFHLQKGVERIRNLENILLREELSAVDRPVAQGLLKDLRSAVRFAEDLSKRVAK